MSAKVVPLSRWLQCLEAATRDLVSTSMRFDAGPAPDPIGERRGGAYIALLGDEASLHLGISASPEGFRTLARGLLGLRRDEPLSDQDVVDGASEVMNILAGKVKSRMSAEDATLKLGLPMFVAAEIQVREGMERESADIAIGPVPCRLQVYRVRRAA